MTFLKKNTSGKKTAPPRRACSFRRMAPIVALAAAAHGGALVDSIFQANWNATHCIANDSLSVAVRKADTMRMEFGPVRPATVSTNPKTPDVISSVNNGFRYFWSDSSTPPHLYSQDISIMDTGVATGQSVDSSAIQRVQPPLRYFHAEAGAVKYAVAFIGNLGDTLKGYYNRSLFNIGAGIYNGSLCRAYPDTFFFVYTDNVVVKVKKVYFAGNNLVALKPDSTIAFNQNNCINPTIAVDSSRTILAVWMRGIRMGAKTLSCVFCDSSMKCRAPVSLSGDVDDRNGLNYYDDAPVVSYARGKFAAVFWDSAGIALQRFEDTSASDVVRVSTQAGARYPAIAANGRFLVVVWRDSTAAQTGAIKGVRYPIVNGTIDTAAVVPILNQPSPLDNLKAPVVINCTMDSAGNVGLGWQISTAASIGVLSSRNILFDSGSWTSLPVRLQSGLRDSVCVDSASLVTGAQASGTACAGFIGLGADPPYSPSAFPSDHPPRFRPPPRGCIILFSVKYRFWPALIYSRRRR